MEKLISKKNINKHEDSNHDLLALFFWGKGFVAL